MLTLAGTSSSTTKIVGSLDAAPDSTFTIQFFANAGDDPSGHGQGQAYLGELTGVSTDATGNASFTFLAVGALSGRFISATATDSDGNTSEFSQDIRAISLPDLAVSVAESPAGATFGGRIAYTFTVANIGPAAASGVVVTDALPPSLVDGSASATLGDFRLAGNVFTDAVASLAAGDSFQVRLMATADSVGSVDNTLVAAPSTTDFDATNNAATASLQVDPAATTTELAATANPSTFGQPVTFTATVDAPDGVVTFLDDGIPFAVAALVAASGTGASASVAVSSLAAGTHAITASYGGDADFAPSTSASFAQAVDPAATTTTLAAPPGPSASGSVASFVATVSGPVAPDGTVIFSEDGAAVAAIALVHLAGGAASSATFMTSSLGAGTHTIAASYDGNANLAGGASTAIVQAVDRSASAIALAASPDPLASGSPLTLTATVTGPASPSGTVTFLDGTSTLGLVAVGPGGQAQLVIPSLGIGTHELGVSYGGDADLLPSTSAALAQVVDAAAPDVETAPTVVNVAPMVVAVVPRELDGRATLLAVTFSVPLDASRARDASNYVLVAGPRRRRIPIASAALSADGLTVTLEPKPALGPGRTYTLEVVGAGPRGLAGAAGAALGSKGAQGGNSFTRFTIPRPAHHAPAGTHRATGRA